MAQSRVENAKLFILTILRLKLEIPCRHHPASLSAIPNGPLKLPT
jgi:hypothetical protein